MNEKLLKTRISEVEKNLNIIIPKVYKDFLNKNPEMEFDDGILYDIDTLEEQYILHEFAEYAPEYIPIGNNNGDYELVMRFGNQTTKFGFLEQGSIGTLKPEHLQDFSKWYENGHNFSFDSDTYSVDWSKNVNIILKKTPENKAKTLMTIRKALNLNIPISDLISTADNPPCILTDKYSAAIAKSIISENHLDEWLEFKF